MDQMVAEDLASHYQRSLEVIKERKIQIKQLKDTIQMHIQREKKFEEQKEAHKDEVLKLQEKIQQEIKKRF